MAQTYLCPECSRKPLASLTGWKRHMSSAHGGYTTEQIAEAAGGASEGVHVTGESSFESAAAAMPETEEGFNRVEILSPENAEDEAEREEAKRSAKATRKKMRARMDKLKEKIARDMPSQAFKFAGLELDSNDTDWIAESIETVFDILGVEFDVEPYSFTVRNRFLILLYPLLVICTILGIKLVQKADAEQKAKQQTEQSSTEPAWKQQ